ncbi:unnamed protein product [Chironomus riparius]|uniref:Uncharacterized protein n=1 Tax=Chironomus riparius TaxID=315576 RepID=A0A9N9S3J4_9DIPT|nr:unnamed protein product [Chironomus riparius]
MKNEIIGSELIDLLLESLEGGDFKDERGEKYFKVGSDNIGRFIGIFVKESELIEPSTNATELNEHSAKATELNEPSAKAPELNEASANAPELIESIVKTPELFEPSVKANKHTEPSVKAPKIIKPSVKALELEKFIAELEIPSVKAPEL